MSTCAGRVALTGWLALSNLRFRDCVLNLSAAIRGMRKDELDGADVRQLRRNRRLVRFGIAAISIAAIVAIWQAIVATQQRDEAVRQARIALARGLGALAQQKLTGDDAALDVALLAATQAAKLDPGPVAKAALLSALQQYPSLYRVLRPGARAYAVEFSPDGSRLASAGEDGAISVWDTSSGKRRLRIGDAHQDKIWGLAFSARRQAGGHSEPRQDSRSLGCRVRPDGGPSYDRSCGRDSLARGER
jgi:WD domain, G-beta repeat